MTYVVGTGQIDLNNRPNFIITDPATMTSPVAMLHHRISWNVLGGAMNQVLAGTAESKVINSLLKLSPAQSADYVKNFKTALNLKLANKRLAQANIDAINAVEQLIFTLPCNLFQGLNQRQDDPANDMDFTPVDIAFDGSLPVSQPGVLTAAGQLQQARERLMNRLLQAQLKPADIDSACAEVVRLWRPAARVPPVSALAQATVFQPACWAPGNAPFAAPAYRHWVDGNLQPLTAAQATALNAVVMTRVRTKY